MPGLLADNVREAYVQSSLFIMIHFAKDRYSSACSRRSSPIIACASWMYGGISTVDESPYTSFANLIASIAAGTMRLNWRSFRKRAASRVHTSIS